MSTDTDYDEWERFYLPEDMSTPEDASGGPGSGRGGAAGPCPAAAVVLGISIENMYLDALHRRWYLDNYGTSQEWADACDDAERAEWLYESLAASFPGVYNCQHGMRLQDCIDPVNHYGPDPY